MEDKAIRGVPWTLLSYAVNKSVSLLATLVLARLLVPADFGLMAIALTAVNFLYWFGGLGFSNALVVHQDLDRRQQGTVLTLMVASSAAAAAVAAGLAPVAAAVFHEPRLTGLLGVMAAAVFLAGIGGFYEALLARELQFRRRFAGLAAQTFTYAVTSIALAVAGGGVWSLVIGQVAGQLAYAIVLVIVAPYRVGPRVDPEVARRVARTGGAFVGQGVTAFLRQNADTVAVGRAFGARSLGFYSMAYRLGDLTYWAIADPVARVTFPGFARVRHRGEDVRPSFLSVLRLVTLIACPAGILLSACAHPLIDAVFGPEWKPMAAPLALIGLWAAVRPVEATVGWLLNAVQHAGSAAWVSVAILVPLIPGLVVAVTFGDLTIVALVPLGDALLSLGLLSLMARRHVGIALRDLWKAVWPVVAASVPMWFAGRFAGPAIGGPAVVELAGAALAAVAAYVLALSIVAPGLLPRAAGQIARTLGRGGPVATPS